MFPKIDMGDGYAAACCFLFQESGCCPAQWLDTGLTDRAAGKLWHIDSTLGLQMSLSSNRQSLPPDSQIGWLISAMAAAIGVYAHASGELLFFVGACITGVTTGLLAIFAPQFLRPLNRVWMTLADLLGRLVSPLVLGGLYFLIVSPLALVLRFFGRDELKLRATDAASFWRARDVDYDRRRSFRDQF